MAGTQPQGSPLARIAEDEIVAPGVAPCASVAVAFRQHGVWRVASGAAGKRSPSRPQPIQPETPFDLASLSKPIVAATLVRLAALGKICLRTPLAELLPITAGTRAAHTTLESLLSHRAALEAHIPLYAPVLHGRAFERDRSLRRAADAAAPDGGGAAARNTTALYSDLGYVLAGAAVEYVLRAPLDDLVQAQIGEPLGVELGSARQWFARDRTFLDRVAPSEVVRWRGGELVGAVHDDNAWALSGHALSGHAGLFGSAEHVARFGCAVLDALSGRATEWLARSNAEFMIEPRSGGTLRAGFDGKSGSESAAGTRAGVHTFGHLGFTGTSIWCDPETECVSVLLTNRVRIGPDRAGIQRARPRVHDALFELGAAWSAT